ncbi:MAG: hypothetical protein ACRC8A_14560 [Microcoleaceae cyanobacterium]
MTGFIRGLFKRNNDRPEQSFYLDSDNAKSYGDIDYMRRASTVKKTFPKAAGEDMPKPAPISSMEKMKNFSSPLTNSAANSSSSTNSSAAPVASFSGFQAQMPSRSFGNPQRSLYSLESERRRPDSKMNEFRKMAREMKK